MGKELIYKIRWILLVMLTLVFSSGEAIYGFFIVNPSGDYLNSPLGIENIYLNPEGTQNRSTVYMLHSAYPSYTIEDIQEIFTKLTNEVAGYHGLDPDEDLGKFGEVLSEIFMIPEGLTDDQIEVHSGAEGEEILLGDIKGRHRTVAIFRYPFRGDIKGIWLFDYTKPDDPILLRMELGNITGYGGGYVKVKNSETDIIQLYLTTFSEPFYEGSDPEFIDEEKVDNDEIKGRFDDIFNEIANVLDSQVNEGELGQDLQELLSIPEPNIWEEGYNDIDIMKFSDIFTATRFSLQANKDEPSGKKRLYVYRDNKNEIQAISSFEEFSSYETQFIFLDLEPKDNPGYIEIRKVITNHFKNENDITIKLYKIGEVTPSSIIKRQTFFPRTWI